MSDEYYEISPKVNDIDFYIGPAMTGSIIDISSSASGTGTKIVNASSTIAIQSDCLNATVFFRKVISASSDVEIQLTAETVPLEILNVLSIINISLSPSVQINKVTYALSSISITSDATGSALKTTEGNSYITVNASTSFTSMKIAKAIAASSISVTPGFHSTLISYLRHQFTILTKVVTNPPVRFSPSYIDSSSIRTLLLLDGKPLTNHKRVFNESLSPNFIETANWNNKKNRYYKRSSTSGRKSFSISWSSLPNAMEDTVDSRHGRDYIHSIAEDPDSHELKIINLDASGTTPYTESTYTVFIRGYSESLTRRFISEGVYLYDCQISMEEV